MSEKFNGIVDNSMLSDYKKCPRYFELRHLEHLAVKDEMSEYKQGYGTAIHYGLEIWYNGIKDGIKPLDDDLRNSAVNGFKESFNKFEGADQYNICTLERGEMILRLYFMHFQHEEFKVIETEIGGAFTFGGITVIFKADMLVEDRFGLCVFETKTSGSRGYLITEPNSQLDTYISGVRANTNTNKPINRALFNQIYYRKGRKGEVLTKTVDFVREETQRDDAMLHEWMQDTIFYSDMIKKSAHEDNYPKNPNNCTAYGGCMFQRICKVSDPALKETLKSSLFSVRKWEPWPGARGNEIKDDKTV